MVLLFLLLFVSPALAQEKAVVTGDFTKLKHTGSARIDKVIDAQTLLMNDGQIVRLLGLDYPFITGGEPNNTAVAAKAYLENKLPKGTEVMLYQTRNQKAGRINRMGHTLAHLALKTNEEWINGDLVADGFAYAVTDATNPEMADQLYKLEDKARAVQKGLWMKASPFGLLTPDTAALGDGAFRVVEGTVNRSGTGNNNLFLNFGEDRNKDFTVQVTPAIRKKLAHSGIDPMSLAGQKIRVRGWIRLWNGPFMELETPERLEILTPPQISGQSNP